MVGRHGGGQHDAEQQLDGGLDADALAAELGQRRRRGWWQDCLAIGKPSQDQASTRCAAATSAGVGSCIDMGVMVQVAGAQPKVVAGVGASGECGARE